MMAVVFVECHAMCTINICFFVKLSLIELITTVYWSMNRLEFLFEIDRIILWELYHSTCYFSNKMQFSTVDWKMKNEPFYLANRFAFSPCSRSWLSHSSHLFAMTIILLSSSAQSKMPPTDFVFEKHIFSLETKAI